MDVGELPGIVPDLGTNSSGTYRHGPVLVGASAALLPAAGAAPAFKGRVSTVLCRHEAYAPCGYGADARQAPEPHDAHNQNASARARGLTWAGRIAGVPMGHGQSAARLPRCDGRLLGSRGGQDALAFAKQQQQERTARVSYRAGASAHFVRSVPHDVDGDRLTLRERAASAVAAPHPILASSPEPRMHPDAPGAVPCRRVLRVRLEFDRCVTLGW